MHKDVRETNIFLEENKESSTQRVSRLTESQILDDLVGITKMEYTDPEKHPHKTLEQFPRFGGTRWTCNSNQLQLDAGKYEPVLE